MCDHDFQPSPQAGYVVCVRCGTYHSVSYGNPIDIYGSQYWSHDSGHSTIAEQVYNVSKFTNDDEYSKNKLVLKYAPESGSDVLEIACAPGDLLKQLGGSFTRVYGLEVDQAYHGEIRRVCGPKPTLLFGLFPEATRCLPDETLDCLIGLDVFEHVPDGEAFISECVRLLRPGGTLILMSPFIYSDNIFDEKMFHPEEHVWIYSEAFLKDAFSREFEAFGFDRWFPGHELFVCRRKGARSRQVAESAGKPGRSGAEPAPAADRSDPAGPASPWKEENLGPESRKAHARRVREGFFDRYFGGVVLDIGYRGYEDLEVVPVLEDAIGIDLNYPGYDGKRLPFGEGTVDTVYASHTLEHIDEPLEAIREWFRVLKVGGHLVLAVPHQFLYEKRTARPSRWNGDHKRFYTPSRLMAEVESALAPNSYRVRRLMDDDESYDYALPPTVHAGGAYQIELVVEKIQPPAWTLEVPEQPVAEPGAGPSLDELNAKLGMIFTDLRSAVEMLSREQDKNAGRLASLARQIAEVRQEVAPDSGRAPEAAVQGDPVPREARQAAPRFFQNRRQLQVLLERLKASGGAPAQVLVVGAGRGCEAYSLAIEADLAGLDLGITALDLDAANLATAAAGIYTPDDFTDFEGGDPIPVEAAGYFLREGDHILVDIPALRNAPYFQVGDPFRHEGLYDAILCNNVLIHVPEAGAERALARLDLLLSKGGMLAVGGAPLDALARYLGARKGFAPVETDLEAIWADWKEGRPPLDRDLPDWKLRFCTLFHKTDTGLGGAGRDPEAWDRWFGGIGSALQGVAQGQAAISDSARTIVDYLDELLK